MSTVGCCIVHVGTDCACMLTGAPVLVGCAPITELCRVCRRVMRRHVFMSSDYVVPMTRPHRRWKCAKSEYVISVHSCGECVIIAAIAKLVRDDV